MRRFRQENFDAIQRPSTNEPRSNDDYHPAAGIRGEDAVRAVAANLRKWREPFPVVENL